VLNLTYGLLSIHLCPENDQCIYYQLHVYPSDSEYCTRHINAKSGWFLIYHDWYLKMCRLNFFEKVKIYISRYTIFNSLSLKQMTVKRTVYLLCQALVGMVFKENMHLFIVLLLSSIHITTSEYATSCRNFDCEYKLLSKLIHLEERTAQQGSKISLLTEKLEGKLESLFFLMVNKTWI
jgi:hypothetical protein